MRLDVAAGKASRDFRCLAQSGVDTTTSTGKLTLAILGAVSAFEADLRAERQAEGIAKAKSAGKYRGRSPSIDYETVKKLHAQGNRPTEIAALLHIGRTSVYRALGADAPHRRENTRS